MSKLCQYCGAEMDDEALECPECLKKIPGADSIRKRKEAEKKEKQKKILKIVLGSVLSVAFITGLVLLVAHDLHDVHVVACTNADLLGNAELDTCIPTYLEALPYKIITHIFL